MGEERAHEEQHFIAVNTSEELAQCLEIRYEVFCDKQGVPQDLEHDEFDNAPSTLHILVRQGEEALGTLRILPEGEGHCHIGRVALRRASRGTGLGKAMMAFGARLARERLGVGEDGTLIIDLSSQTKAIGFYEACGYELLPGEEYLDAGIPHRDMRLVLGG